MGLATKILDRFRNSRNYGSLTQGWRPTCTSTTKCRSLFYCQKPVMSVFNTSHNLIRGSAQLTQQESYKSIKTTVLPNSGSDMKNNMITITKYTDDFHDQVLRLIGRDRYTIRAALLHSLRTPFLHITAATLSGIYLIFPVLDLNVFLAIACCYCFAGSLYVILTHLLLASNLWNYGTLGGFFDFAEQGAMLVAIDSSKTYPCVVGTIAIKQISAGLGYMAGLVIHRDYRGLGIGRELLSTAIRYSVSMGHHAVTFETWDVSTDFALEPIYIRAGFNIMFRKIGPFWWLPMYEEIHFIKYLKED